MKKMRDVMGKLMRRERLSLSHTTTIAKRVLLDLPSPGGAPPHLDGDPARLLRLECTTKHCGSPLWILIPGRYWQAICVRLHLLVPLASKEIADLLCEESLTAGKLG